MPVLNSIADNTARMTEWRRHLHTIPEVRFDLHQTAAFVAERLRVADALVSVTDARAETTKHKTAQKLYHRFRPSALINVEEGIPELASLVTRYGQRDPAPAVAAATGA